MSARLLTTTSPPPSDDSDKLGQFRIDIVSDAEVVEDQRDKANEDIRFVNVDGGQWEGFLTGNADQPNRVKLELDTVSNPLQRFIGEWSQNRVGVDYKSDDQATSDDDAELLNGIYRSDFRDFSGRVATDNAVSECATCGFGSFKLATEFEDDGDPENENQHVVWVPIYNSYNTVYWDQAAQRIDKRDARRCTILAQFTRTSFEDSFPGKDPVSAYNPNTLGYENTNVRQIDLVYVATRYDVVRNKETVFVYNNLMTDKVDVYSADDHELIKDELKASDTHKFVRKRKIIKQSVEKTVFSGADILEPTRRIAGKYIPVVSMYGYHAFVDGTERYRGIVRKLKDAARLYNQQVSQLCENAASAGQEVPIFTVEQMENPDIQKIWANKNNKSYLVVDSVKDADGNPIQSGPIGYSKPASLDQSTATLLQLVPNYIKDTSGFAAGEAIKKETSGKAMRAIMKRENMNTQVINTNIANAIEWSGEIYQAMASEIYTTRRMVKTLGKDGETDAKQQLLTHVLDEETGRMIEANDLRGKRFKSYSDVGPQYDSVREETVEDIKGMVDVVQAIPGGERYMPLLLSTMVENIVGVGLGPLKELNRTIMLEQGSVKPETPEEEAIVQNLQQQAQQPDPQQVLIESAAAQQQAEARSLDASSVQKIADANKKDAETVKTLSEVGVDKAKVQEQAIQTRLKAFQGLQTKPQADARS